MAIVAGFNVAYNVDGVVAVVVVDAAVNVVAAADPFVVAQT